MEYVRIFLGFLEKNIVRRIWYNFEILKFGSMRVYIIIWVFYGVVIFEG